MSVPTPWLADPDVTLYHGDALQVLRQLPDESVDCVVTSPPYWGLRDYGTGEWEGGDPGCGHEPRRWEGPKQTQGAQSGHASKQDRLARTECKCGARRVDRQMGLEATQDEFVQNMVEVFREVRRVLAAHGTCWVNLGDSYAGSSGNGGATEKQSTNVGSFHNGGTRMADGLKPKDLVGIPWRVAFALQADGWYLRSDIVWAKPNPMPESVTDRPTKSHEYVFLLTKQPRYWFDQEAVREDATWDRWSSKQTTPKHTDNGNDRYASFGREWTEEELERYRAGGRNVRSVWTIATQPYPEAHFATFPEELARRCIVAGCPVRVCRVCGKPSERIVDVSPMEIRPAPKRAAWQGSGDEHSRTAVGGTVTKPRESTTVGWSDCGHNAYRPGVVLDPFMGSGTVAKVARDHQRHAIGIDLNEQYLELAARRLQQLSLLNEATT